MMYSNVLNVQAFTNRWGFIYLWRPW